MRLFHTLLVPLALRAYRRAVCTTCSSRSGSSSIRAFMSTDSTKESFNPSTTKTARIIHLNHAGASPSPPSVVDTVLKHMQLEQKMGGYTAAEMAAEQLGSVYQRVAQLLHLPNNYDHDIALVESATVGWTRLFYSMANYQHQHKRRLSSPHKNNNPLVILISEAEYAANVVAACQWAKDHNDWTVLAIPSSRSTSGCSTGCVDIEVLQQMLQGAYRYQTSNGTEVPLDPANIAMVCVTHIPTNSGIVNEVEAIGRSIAKLNSNYNNNPPTVVPSCLYLIDACQSAGQRELDVEKLYCHGLVATGRKFLRGPRGTGFLHVPKNIANQLTPHHVDHFGVPVVRVPPLTNALPIESVLEFQPKQGAARFEFYESNLANKLGFGEAIRFALDEVGMNHIQSAGLALAQDLYCRLDSYKQVQVHHPPACGIVTFYVPGVPSNTIKDKLWKGDDIKFETSLVPATSTPLDSARTQVPDMVRVSLSYANTVDDVDAFCVRLESILATLQ
jgi:cysteine desulfurase / selenocysteine lyase